MRIDEMPAGREKSRKRYEIDCVGVDNKDLAEAVKVIIEPEEGR